MSEDKQTFWALVFIGLIIVVSVVLSRHKPKDGQ